MKLYINWVSADTVMRCKKSEEVMDHIQLINPMSFEGGVLFDMIVDLPTDYKISGKTEGINEYIIIQLSKLGAIELNTKDFRDITICG